jgi:hypothetical protein
MFLFAARLAVDFSLAGVENAKEKEIHMQETV